MSSIYQSVFGISVLQGQMVAFHIAVFRFCALEFVYKGRPLYVIYLSTDSP